MNPDLFYTYIYYDPSRNNEPIYVGYGQKDRVWRHNYPIIECPHCGKRCGSATMPRWQFDRCKLKKGNKEND